MPFTKMWKMRTRARWDEWPFRKKSGLLSGLIALGATMITITATSTIPAFWDGVVVGLWTGFTLVAIGLQVHESIRFRRLR